MFFTFKSKKVVKPMEKDLDRFIMTRRGNYGAFSTADSHRKYIRSFIDATGIERVEEIDNRMIEAYLDSVKAQEHTDLSKMTASIAIRQFIAFMERREMKEHKGKVGRPPKEERNLEMVALRKFDKKRWSIQALATKYGITKRAVWEILERYKDLL